MGDSSILVTPTGATKVDTGQYVTDAGTVERERVEDIEMMAIARSLRDLVLLFGTAFDTSGQLRAVLGAAGGGASTAATTITSGTVTTVSTVSTVTTTTTVGTVTALANLAPAGVTNPSQYLLNEAALIQRLTGIG